LLDHEIIAIQNNLQLMVISRWNISIATECWPALLRQWWSILFTLVRWPIPSQPTQGYSLIVVIRMWLVVSCLK